MLIWNQGPPSFPAAGNKPFCIMESWVLDRIPLLSSWVNMGKPPAFLKFSVLNCKWVWCLIFKILFWLTNIYWRLPFARNVTHTLTKSWCHWLLGTSGSEAWCGNTCQVWLPALIDGDLFSGDLHGQASQLLRKACYTNPSWFSIPEREKGAFPPAHASVVVTLTHDQINYGWTLGD